MGLNVLFAIHDMRSIWDVRYWQVSPYKTVVERERERVITVCIYVYVSIQMHIDI